MTESIIHWKNAIGNIELWRAGCHAKLIKLTNEIEKIKKSSPNITVALINFRKLCENIPGYERSYILIAGRNIIVGDIFIGDESCQ